MAMRTALAVAGARNGYFRHGLECGFERDGGYVPLAGKQSSYRRWRCPPASLWAFVSTTPPTPECYITPRYGSALFAVGTRRGSG